MSASLDHDHPWPGPDSFRIQDASFFRGREREIGELLDLIRRSRSAILFGASGLGKTSLVNAGVVPRLREDEYFAVPIRISYVSDAPSVSEQIQAEILAHAGASNPGPAWQPGRTTWELLHRRNEAFEKAQPLLLFDQFEELFTIGVGTRQSAQLIEELKALIEGTPPASVRERFEHSPDEARTFSFQRNDHRLLISVREDYLYGLEALRAEIPSLIHNRYRIEALRGPMAMEVVTQPSRSKEESRPTLVAPEVAELIVRTVASTILDGRPLASLEIDPALLSVLCTELALRRPVGVPITKALVAGNRAEIIATFYERAMKAVPAAARAFIEDKLVTDTGYRTSAVLCEALTIPGFTSLVLDDLVKHRVLRVIERPNAQWIELTHDILTEFAVQGRKARQGEAARVEAARARAARDQVRVRRVLVGASVLLAAVAVLGGFLKTKYNQNVRTLDETKGAKRALRRQFIDTSLREDRYREALAHLAAAFMDEPVTSSTSALLGDLVIRRSWPLPAPAMFPEGPFSYLSCNRAGTRCAAAYRDGRVLVRGDRSFELKTGVVGYGSLAMSADGSRLTFVPESPGEGAQWILGPTEQPVRRFSVEKTWNKWSASDNGEIVVVPRSKFLQVRSFASPDSGADLYEVLRGVAPDVFDVSADGRWLSYLKCERTCKIGVTDLPRKKEVRRLLVTGTVSDLKIDPKSAILFAALEDGTLLRWRLRDAQALPPLKAKRAIRSLNFDGQGQQMLLELEGGSLELRRAEDWSKAQPLNATGSGYMSLSFSQDGRWITGASRDGVVAVWSSSGQQLAEPLQQDRLAFSALLANRELVSVALSGASTRWTLPMQRVSDRFDLSRALVGAHFQTESSFFAYGPGWIQVGRPGPHNPVQRLRQGVLVAGDLGHVATVYRESLVVRDGLPSPDDDDSKDRLLLEDGIDTCAFSGDGKQLVATASGKGYVFDVATGHAVGKPISNVASAWLNEDGTLLVTKKADVGVVLWRCDPDGSRTSLTDIPLGTLGTMAFDRAGDTLVLVVERMARIWSLRDRAFVGRPLVHDGPILSTEFSPDRRWIVTTSDDRRARIWDAKSGLPASDWFQHGDSVVAASFSPSGKKLLTATKNGQVRIWPLAGSGDGTDGERRRLARLAEILSGKIDPETNEVVPASHGGEAIVALRKELEKACPKGRVAAGCDSATTGLVRSILDGEDGAPSPR